jgi:hypothetical protein
LSLTIYFVLTHGCDGRTGTRYDKLARNFYSAVLLTPPTRYRDDNRREVRSICALQHPATRKGWIMLLVETLHEMKSGLLRAREIGTIKA